MNLFGINLDPILGAMQQGIGGMMSNGGGSSDIATGSVQPPSPLNPFAGLSYGQNSYSMPSYANSSLNVPDRFAGPDPLAFGGGSSPVFGDFWAAKGRRDAAVQQAAQSSKTAAPGSQSGTWNSTGSGAPPAVAKWAGQTQQTFGDLLDPDIMLAIMQNESGGDPNAYNPAGDAHGLFQQVGFASSSPDEQFKAARQLAQQKVAAIDAAYAAHGLDPDARTRARDFALAWAGHFDYGTGLPNPSSRDVGSGQTADQLSNIFLKNYDAIKAAGSTKGAQQGGTTSGGLAAVTGGQTFPVMQEFGRTDYSVQHPSTYAYGKSYGLAGDEHPGVDWAAPIGTQVYTPVGGTVSVVGNDHGSGYYYTNTMTNSDPDHSGEFAITLANGDVLILGHMSNINAQVGQHLDPGTMVGLSGGSDGAHVHVEYRQKQSDGSYRIVDPRTVLR